MLTAGTILDRYTVECPLGQGGMAVVYRVVHNQLGTRHALKVLSMPVKSIRDRLIQEGRVQAALRHPNIVAVTDIIEVDGAPGLVMEYISGPSLEQLLEKERMSMEQADYLAQGILSGVMAAHKMNLIHRDLKPANVLLAIHPTLVPKVADFGLAKLLGNTGGPTQTRSGMTMGTPAYMAPEQIRDTKGVDHRADVFSLGCILYELVCGQRTFGGDDLLDLMTAVAQGNFTPPKTLIPELPDRMERAILGALVVDRDQRIGTVEELLSIWMGRDVQVAPSALWSGIGVLETESAAFVNPVFSGGVAVPSRGRSMAAVNRSDATLNLEELSGKHPSLLRSGMLSGATFWDTESADRPRDKGASLSSTQVGWVGLIGGLGLVGLFLFLLGLGGVFWMVQRSEVHLMLDASPMGVEAHAPVEHPLSSPEEEPSEPPIVPKSETVDAAPVKPHSAEHKRAKPATIPPARSFDRVKKMPRVVAEKAPVEERPPEVVEPVVAPMPPEVVVKAPAVIPSGKAQLTFEGDVVLWLQSPFGRVEPGWVEPGDYKVMVSFGGRAPRQVNQVSLKAGEHVHLNCLAQWRLCSVKK